MLNTFLKSLLILPFIIGSLLVPLCAQNIGLGFKAGLDFSTQLNRFQFTSGELELDLDPSFTPGYHIGLIYRNRISKNFRVQAEPAFLRIGAKYTEPFTIETSEVQTDSETKLYYFHLPVLLELTSTPPDLQEVPIPWEETTYHATIGLYGSYLIDAVFLGTISRIPIGIEEADFFNNVTNQFNNFDAGLIVGGGFEYGYQSKFGFATRLMLGLLNSNSENTFKFKADNLAITAGVYYLF